MTQYFPKGDARRYFVVLLAADRLKARATLHYLSPGDSLKWWRPA